MENKNYSRINFKKFTVENIHILLSIKYLLDLVQDDTIQLMRLHMPVILNL